MSLKWQGTWSTDDRRVSCDSESEEARPATAALSTSPAWPCSCRVPPDTLDLRCRLDAARQKKRF